MTAGIPSRTNSLFLLVVTKVRDNETYHCQPAKPALPLRYEMPVARSPPKAPATATLEAKMAILVALSSGLYQKQRYIMILGLLVFIPSHTNW